MEIVIPRVLNHFDLPDVASLIAPRTLWVVDPQTATRVNAPLKRVMDEYAPALKAYGDFSDQVRVRLLNRPEGSTFKQMYGSWLTAS